MSSVYVGIGHYYYLMISELLHIKVVSDTAAESRYHILYLVRIEYSVESCFFYIEDLTSERKYRLAFSVSAVFCASSGGISLDEEYLALRRIFVRTVCEFSGKRKAVQSSFSSGQISGFSGRLSCSGCFDTFFQYYLSLSRIFF